MNDKCQDKLIFYNLVTTRCTYGLILCGDLGKKNKFSWGCSDYNFWCIFILFCISRNLNAIIPIKQSNWNGTVIRYFTICKNKNNHCFFCFILININEMTNSRMEDHRIFKWTLDMNVCRYVVITRWLPTRRDYYNNGSQRIAFRNVCLNHFLSEIFMMQAHWNRFHLDVRIVRQGFITN